MVLKSGLKSANKLQKTRPKRPMPTQRVIGFPIAASSFDAQVNVMMTWAKARQSRVVCVSNVHMLMEGHWNKKFSDVLMQADLLTPDGMPLVWMTGLMNRHSQDRVAGMDLMLVLCQQAEMMNVGIFFLGSKPSMLSTIREKLLIDFPDLQIAGMFSPPFRPLSEAENADIVDQINQSNAGLVFVSLGCPKQEHWMSQHRGPVKAVMVGLGGAFSVYAGEKRWAPKLLREYGLEWSYRLMQEPRRLWKRYASTIPPFLWLAFTQVVKIRLGLDPNRSLWQQITGGK